MNTRRGLPVQVVVSDTGPLISLAACGRLDLFTEFRRPVRVPDVVRAECLRHPGKIGTATLEAWFDPSTCPAEVLATPFMAAWEKAVPKEEANPELHASLGIGNAALAWLLRQAQAGIGLDVPTLILTEDGPFGDGIVRDRFPEVHVLSTRAFLRTLENFGQIPSAERIIEEIARAGRQLARYMADRPGRISPGVRMTWADALESQAASGPGNEPWRPS